MTDKKGCEANRMRKRKRMEQEQWQGERRESVIPFEYVSDAAIQSPLKLKTPLA